MDFNKIYQSNRSGPFKIIKDLGRVNGRNRCEIQFINTGYSYDVLTHNAFDGRVVDKTLNGAISKDYDISRFDNYEQHINTLLKLIYKHMIDRCYNESTERFPIYGAKGITVCEEWLSDINIFLKDAREIDGFMKYYYSPYLYELDKDYKQMHIPKENRIYSKQTCMFLYYQDNINLRRIDNMRECGSQSNYFGVELNAAGNYYARITVNGTRLNIGTFSNPIAAANAFNYWELYFHDFELVPLLNDVPYMPPNEFVKYNLNVKQMYHLI